MFLMFSVDWASIIRAESTSDSPMPLFMIVAAIPEVIMSSVIRRVKSGRVILAMSENLRNLFPITERDMLSASRSALNMTEATSFS